MTYRDKVPKKAFVKRGVEPDCTHELFSLEIKELFDAITKVSKSLDIGSEAQRLIEAKLLREIKFTVALLQSTRREDSNG